MKTIIIFIIFWSLLTTMTKAQTRSDITYDFGSSVEVQTGADVCADKLYIYGSWSGGGTICRKDPPGKLSLFTHSTDKRSVTLMWVTEQELNSSGFEVERIPLNPINGEPVEWQKIAFIASNGTTNTSNGYIFKDENLNTGKYKYRLKQVDYSGSYEYYELLEEVIISPPGRFEMGQNYPNPGNPNTKINFEMPVNGKVNIVVYDMLGREVVTLLNETRKADYYTIEFDGSNIASGVYFYRIYAEGGGQKFTKTLKMIIVK